VLQYETTEFVNLFAVVAREKVLHILLVVFGLEVCMERLEFGKVHATPRTVVFIGIRVFVVLDVLPIAVAGAKNSSTIAAHAFERLLLPLLILFRSVGTHVILQLDLAHEASRTEQAPVGFEVLVALPQMLRVVRSFGVAQWAGPLNWPQRFRMFGVPMLAE
jgi:hypothetical protein